MKNQFNVAAAALAIALSGAQAADLPVVTPPVVEPIAPANDWSGFYAGIHGGYGFGETELTTPGTVADWDIDGWLAGVQAGYNFQSGMWLFGIEADIAYSSIDGSVAFPQGPTITTDIDWLATIRARAGLHYDQWMPYLTGGVAFADVEHTVTAPAFATSDTLVGWTVGGGVEAMFNPSWTAKLEYLYVDLEDVDFTITPAGAPPITGTFDDNFHVIRAGLNYHF